MKTTRRSIHSVNCIFLIALAGCSQPAPAPGVTYSASAVTKSPDGKLKQFAPAITIDGAVVNDVAEVTYDGGAITVQVRKTSYGKATFAITFPDKTTRMVALKAGSSKDLLPKGQKVGLRIQVQEAH